jgi:hypothetical protein
MRALRLPLLKAAKCLNLSETFESVYLASQLDDNCDQCQDERRHESRLLAIECPSVGKYAIGQIMYQVAHKVLVKTYTSACDDFRHHRPHVVSALHEQCRCDDPKRDAKQRQREEPKLLHRPQADDGCRNHSVYPHNADRAGIQRSRARYLTLKLALGQRLQR